jgi:hypothetical protein
MILLPRAVRVYFATAPANLRKSFEGLSNEVRSVLGRDPLSGHVFVFLNRRRNQGEAAAVDPAAASRSWPSGWSVEPLRFPRR